MEIKDLERMELEELIQLQARLNNNEQALPSFMNSELKWNVNKVVARKRMELFKKVKNEYTKRSLWKRAVVRLQGRSPSWKKVNKFNSQELMYLIKVSKGQTKMQHKTMESYMERLKEDGIYKHPREIKKIMAEKNWNLFLHKMKQYSLSNDVALENNGRTL